MPPSQTPPAPNSNNDIWNLWADPDTYAALDPSTGTWYYYNTIEDKQNGTKPTHEYVETRPGVYRWVPTGDYGNYYRTVFPDHNPPDIQSNILHALFLPEDNTLNPPQETNIEFNHTLNEWLYKNPQGNSVAYFSPATRRWELFHTQINPGPKPPPPPGGQAHQVIYDYQHNTWGLYPSEREVRTHIHDGVNWRLDTNVARFTPEVNAELVADTLSGNHEEDYVHGGRRPPGSNWRHPIYDSEYQLRYSSQLPFDLTTSGLYNNPNYPFSSPASPTSGSMSSPQQSATQAALHSIATTPAPSSTPTPKLPWEAAPPFPAAPPLPPGRLGDPINQKHVYWKDGRYWLADSPAEEGNPVMQYRHATRGWEPVGETNAFEKRAEALKAGDPTAVEALKRTLPPNMLDKYTGFIDAVEISPGSSFLDTKKLGAKKPKFTEGQLRFNAYPSYNFKNKYTDFYRGNAISPFNERDMAFTTQMTTAPLTHAGFVSKGKGQSYKAADTSFVLNSEADNPAGQGLYNPTYTQTDYNLQGRGAASQMYNNLIKYVGIPGPSETQLGPGRALWKKMWPGYDARSVLYEGSDWPNTPNTAEMREYNDPYMILQRFARYKKNYGKSGVDTNELPPIEYPYTPDPPATPIPPYAARPTRKLVEAAASVEPPTTTGGVRNYLATNQNVFPNARVVGPSTASASRGALPAFLGRVFPRAMSIYPQVLRAGQGLARHSIMPLTLASSIGEDVEKHDYASAKKHLAESVGIAGGLTLADYAAKSPYVLDKFPKVAKALPQLTGAAHRVFGALGGLGAASELWDDKGATAEYLPASIRKPLAWGAAGLGAIVPGAGQAMGLGLGLGHGIVDPLTRSYYGGKFSTPDYLPAGKTQADFDALDSQISDRQKARREGRAAPSLVFNR